MKKLILIDGNAMMHRAYHAMPPLTNTAGEPVNAVYGFFSMLFQIFSDQKPEYLAVCFDKSKPTIRQSMYAGYHAHRPEMESDLSSQFVLVGDLLGSLKAPEYSLDGYEGDDMIGTISNEVKSERLKVKGSSKEEIETIIVTGDRDMLQLVDKTTKVLMPQNSLGKTVLFDEAAVEEKYGVKPEQFVDYKALIGDASDGYPGVTGIGPKTAASLIQEFGSFENIYKKIDQIPDKIAIKLATDAEQAALAQKLATIVRDAPMQFQLKDTAISDFDFAGLVGAFKKQGFKTVTKRYEDYFLGGAKVDEPKKETKKESDQLDLI